MFFVGLHAEESIQRKNSIGYTMSCMCVVQTLYKDCWYSYLGRC